MTAEIALLNRNAVALAADSAVTLNRPTTPKVYNTANKLFMLSKFHPVGIMVYGSASFMTVPWETVIKVYRNKLGERGFEFLASYAEHFLNFLATNNSLFSDAAKVDVVKNTSYWALNYVKDSIDKRVGEEIDKSGLIDDEGVESVARAVAEELAALWLQNPRLDCFPEDFEQRIIELHRTHLDEVIDAVFQKLPISAIRETLLAICALRMTRRMSGDSGLVFAGFGKKEFLPVVQSYSVDAIICGKLQHQHQPSLSNDVNQTGGASIIPFAQAEIVYRYLQGIDPDYKAEYGTFIRELLSAEYPQTLADKFRDRLDVAQARDLQAELIKIGRDIASRFSTKWADWEHRKFIGPVLDIVGELPKDELAAMAESLVNLTSFKRRITAETETVGGPIDVAVISKGDGFIWIKRKHYFDKELNPSFFSNYYWKESEDVRAGEERISRQQDSNKRPKRRRR